MALFEMQDLSRSAIKKSKASAVSIPGRHLFWDKTQKKISHLDSFSFEENETIHFTSEGAWSMHELVLYLLKRFGSGKVYFTTWAISEIAMRQLFFFHTEGLITEMYAVLDYRNTSRKPAELAFITQNATKLKLAKCHAKVTVIVTDTHYLSISTSANYTRNPRIEAGTITISKIVAQHHIDWITKIVFDET